MDSPAYPPLLESSLVRRGFRQKARWLAVLCAAENAVARHQTPSHRKILAWLALPLSESAADLVREAASLRKGLVEYQRQNGQESTKVLGEAMAPLATEINLARKGLPVSPGAGAQIGGGWLSSW